MEYAVDISVVVPTYHRPELLARCLTALASQSLASWRFEIIIVDDGASEVTKSQVERFQASGFSCTVYLRTSGGCGPATARNIGWRAARGALIAFTDDDTIPDRDWLKRGFESVQAPGILSVWGRVVVPLEHFPPTDFERETAKLETAGFVTANCFCRRDALEAIGGFDERFAKAWREDSDLFFALLKLGTGKIVFDPNPMVVHPVRAAPWGVSIKLQRNAIYNALLFKKHGALYRLYIQAHPPWNTYVHVLSGVLCLLLLLGGESWWIIGAFGSLWFLTLMRLLGVRLKGASRASSHILEMAMTSLVIPWLSVYWRLRGAIQYRVLFF